VDELLTLLSFTLNSPASHVTNKTGAKIQKAFFEELMQKLDAISPGVSSNL
jgi:hypothetical protein